VDPVVLQAVGYDPEKYGGFAAGFGVERFAMIMHNIQVSHSIYLGEKGDDQSIIFADAVAGHSVVLGE